MKYDSRQLFEKKDSGTYRLFRDSFAGGQLALPNQEEDFGWQDAMSSPNAAVWIPKVVTEIAREAVEPNLVLTSLLDRVTWQPGLQVVYGAIGALTAEDIGEQEAYPEVQLQIGGATVTAEVGKSGVAFKFTDELRESTRLDIFNLHVRAAGRALARHKEKKVANYLTSMGVTVFDNEEPATSALGVTHGRDEQGTANGSMTPDDMFDLFGIVINNGFMPNLLIIHPLTWVMFMKDPVLRHFALASGSGTWWGSYSGNPAGRAPWGNPKTGPTNGQNARPSAELKNQPQVGTLNSAPEFPSYFLPFPFQVVVSPFVYYDPGDRLTDVIVADRAELGALIVAEEVNMEQWRKPEFDLEKVKLREKYGIQIYNEGLGIAVARNIKIDPNSIVLPARATIDASTLSAINPWTPVV